MYKRQEYKVGTFKRSVNPNVNNFRDFPKYLNKLKKNKPVAMFCTGGIRCEKTSVYLKHKGFKNIYQLNGGILNYLNKIKKDKRSKKFEEGVSCPNCNDDLTETQKSRFRMRQSQIYKAKQSGKKHIFQKEFK